jgi:hypothetical protein
MTRSSPIGDPVDCVPGNTWGEFGKCIKGIKTKTKNTISPSKYGGNCNLEKQTESCVSNCEVGDWGEYTKCSFTNTRKTRTRPTISPPYNGGTCNDKLTETVDCDPIEGEWSYLVGDFLTNYGTVNISLQSVESDGVKNYYISGGNNIPYRYLTYNPTTSYFGLISPNRGGFRKGIVDENNYIIELNLSERDVINLKRPSRPIDCIQGNTWGEFGECIKGVKTKTKNTISPPKYGGKCNLEKQTEPCVSNCEVGDWGEFGDCIKGKKTKIRPTISPPYNGGTCDYILTETVDCDRIEGIWPSYKISGIEYGPVNISLQSIDSDGVKTYYISGLSIPNQYRYMKNNYPDLYFTIPDTATIFARVVDINGNVTNIGHPSFIGLDRASPEV